MAWKGHQVSLENSTLPVWPHSRGLPAFPALLRASSGPAPGPCLCYAENSRALPALRGRSQQSVAEGWNSVPAPAAYTVGRAGLAALSAGSSPAFQGATYNLPRSVIGQMPSRPDCSRGMLISALGKQGSVGPWAAWPRAGYPAELEQLPDGNHVRMGEGKGGLHQEAGGGNFC